MAEDADEVGLDLLWKFQHRVEILLHQSRQFVIALLEQFCMSDTTQEIGEQGTAL